MATLAQITLIIACASLVDCRFLRRFHKHLPDGHHQDHQAVDTNVRDADAVVFPSDNNSHLITDDSKVNQESNVKNPNIHDVKVKDHKANVDIVMPLVSKIIPEVEVKDVFTNPVSEKIITDKIIDDKKPDILLVDFDAELKDDSVKNEIQNITENVTNVLNMSNTVANFNETVPDFSSRFGGTGNYMLVPVAANVQNYQPMQSNPNVIPLSNGQGNIPAQTYVTPTELNTNNQQPSHVGQNVQYATPNGISDIGATLQTANIASNIGPVQLTNNANFAQETNTYVPVNVPNTYVINGRLYAEVTVPNNGYVPSALYYVNPQIGNQVTNGMPLYKLVSVNGENQLQNIQ